MYVTGDFGNTWVETQKLVASDSAVDDDFGTSVAVYNFTIVVGSWKNDNQRGINAGI